MTIHNWKEHKIEVRGYTLPKYLWMALSLKIVIDDKYTFESPKELEGLKSKVPFEVIEMGNT